MSIILDEKIPFSLDYSLDCGQVFRWSKVECGWSGVVGETVVRIAQNDRHLTFSLYPEIKSDSFVRHYFRLDDNLLQILDSINKDDFIASSIQKLHGLRLIRQDPWECLISFICATYTNIPRIKQMIENICKEFGERIEFEDCVYYGFPDRESLAEASIDELTKCGLGFRAKYVKGTSCMLCDGFDLEGLKELGYEEARRHLMTLPGVGLKVADCILLFSFDKLEVFPVDVRIHRIITQHYQVALGSPSTSYEHVRKFGQRYFGEYAGYAQEYLYHHYKVEKNSIKSYKK